MKSFNLLWSSPISLDQYDPSERRYFIDGKRVTQDEYRKLLNNCARVDSFRTYRFAGRYHFRSVCYR
jgi:hypothetical protein